jgi:hypothetical protein
MIFFLKFSKSDFYKLLIIEWIFRRSINVKFLERFKCQIEMENRSFFWKLQSQNAPPPPHIETSLPFFP